MGINGIVPKERTLNFSRSSVEFIPRATRSLGTNWRAAERFRPGNRNASVWNLTLSHIATSQLFLAISKCCNAVVLVWRKSRPSFASAIIKLMFLGFEVRYHTLNLIVDKGILYNFHIRWFGTILLNKIHGETSFPSLPEVEIIGTSHKWAPKENACCLAGAFEWSPRGNQLGNVLVYRGV